MAESEWGNFNRNWFARPKVATEKCPRCGGSGKWRQGICRACDGRGRLVSIPVAKLSFSVTDEEAK